MYGGQVGIGAPTGRSIFLLETGDVSNDELLSHRSGYQDQLERARRALGRLRGPFSTAMDFQDSAWSFFQHCWHLRDWLRYDPSVPQVAKVSVLARVSQSTALQTCRALCYGSRQLRPAAAGHLYPATTVTAAHAAFDRQSMPSDDLGISMAGTMFATECLAEWETILGDEGLGSPGKAIPPNCAP